MSTTTIRLPDELKARLQGAAKRAGTTAHNFILEAIAEKAERAERRSDFEAAANARYSKILASGRTIPWSDVRSYLLSSASNRSASRPVARKRTHKA